MAILRKYSLDPLYFVKPKTFEGIIEFTVDGEPTIKKGAYLTTNEFDTAEKAHQYLAITYTPKFEIIFEFDEEGTYGAVELRNPWLANQPTRIWPAFGLHGGGCEIILIEGTLNCTEKKERFPNGGVYDLFHWDSAKSDKIFVSHLAQIFWNWLTKRKKEIPDKERPAMKIMDGLGIVLSWIGTPSYKRYAISCAYNNNKNFVDIKFWGYVWDDNEGNEERVLSKPTIKDMRVDFSIEVLRKKIKEDEDLKKG
ncbi:MAG: hypothetical protein AB1393_08005 [Candidatus Edwardsbacteria bacterium]